MVPFFLSLQSYADLGLLVLRISFGVIFLYHGRPKLGSSDSFMKFIGVAELLGGTALILGFLTQLAALGLAIIMAGATYKKINEWHVPFSAMDKMGWEFDLSLLSGCVALFYIGGGSMAVDRMLLGL